jgi:hypothetical protein
MVGESTVRKEEVHIVSDEKKARVKRAGLGPIEALEVTTNSEGVVALTRVDIGSVTDIHQAIAAVRKVVAARETPGRFVFRREYLRGDGAPLVLEVSRQTQFTWSV